MLEVHATPYPAEDCLVVTLRGDASLHEVDRLQLALQKAGSSHPRRAIIDVAAVTFMASLAIGTLVQFASGVKARQGRVALAGAAGPLLDAIKRSRLDTLFVMCESVPQARDEMLKAVPAL